MNIVHKLEAEIMRLGCSAFFDVEQDAYGEVYIGDAEIGVSINATLTLDNWTKLPDNIGCKDTWNAIVEVKDSSNE